MASEEDIDGFYADLVDSRESSPKPELSSLATPKDEKLPGETTPIAIQTDVQVPCAIPATCMPFLHIYPISNYSFGVKDAILDVETSYHSRMTSLEESFLANGMRRTVEAVMVVYENNHPHVLLLQMGESNLFKLPGDSLAVGEDEFTILPSKLNQKLSPTGSAVSWNIDPECLGVWYRPNFESSVYPYSPAHILRPKERISLFLIKLPSTFSFAIPKNAKLIAVPLCDLYDNSSRYGPMIAGIPLLLSKYNIICA